MRKSLSYPTAEQQSLDRAMARAQALFPARRNKTLLQNLAGLFTALNRSRRAENAKRLARGNVDER